jgi:hypothetical protein
MRPRLTVTSLHGLRIGSSDRNLAMGGRSVVHAGIGIDRRQRRAGAMGSAIEVRQWPQFHVAVRTVFGRPAATFARTQRPRLCGPATVASHARRFAGRCTAGLAAGHRRRPRRCATTRCQDGWRRCDGMAKWRRESAWLWTIGRLVAAFGFAWVSRGLTCRWQSPGGEEYGREIAPLIAFALLWLLVGSGRRSNAV